MINMLYDLLYMLPACLIAVLVPNLRSVFTVQGPVLVGAEIVIAIAVVYMFNTRNRIKYLLPAFLIMLTIALTLLKTPEERTEFLRGFIWVYELIGISIVCELAGRLAEDYRWVRLMQAVGAILCVVLSLVFKYEIGRPVIALCFLIVLFLLADEVQTRWIKRGDTDRKKHLVFTSPFVLAVCLLVMNIPVKEEPYDWKLFMNLWHKTVEIAEDVAGFMPGKKTSTFTEVGFSDRAFMSEINSNSDRVIMNVTPGAGAGRMVYLAAGSFDSFDGREWSAVNQEAGPVRLLDLVEMQCAVRKWDREHYSDYIKTGSVDISYLRYKPGIIFAPSKTVLLGDRIDNVEFTEKLNSILEDSKAGRNISYRVRFDRLNMDKDKFAYLMENRLPISASEWENGLSIVTKNNIVGTTYEDYLRYRDDIYTRYYEEVPVSDKVNALISEITDDADSEWDRLKKVEVWLNGLTYKWDTDELPESVNSQTEFLDYFMTESREGYCVHFATAMALIARTEGLPSRVTQGVYVLSGTPNVQVTSRMAHVWTEVYFDNFGWVSFEPTPGYKVDNSWMVSDDFAQKEPIKLNENYVEPDKDIVATEAEQEDTEKAFPVKMVLIITGVILAFFAIFASLFRIMGKRQLNKLGRMELAKLYCRRNILLLGYLGYKIGSSETLSEYADRLSVNAEPGREALEFISVYERLIYSDTAFDEEWMTIIESSYETMINMSGRRHSLRRIIIEVKLFTGMITG